MFPRTWCRQDERIAELDRAREPVADDFDDRLMPNERFPEIEVRRIPEPADVLERQRIAQAELLAQARDELLLCGPVADPEGCRADHGVDGVPGDQMQDREDEQRRE